MNIKKFIFMGISAWIYSIAVQTPFAMFVWDFTADQYIKWMLAGLPITMIFFGSAIHLYLNECDKLYERKLK